jgi:predicted nucleic acid-binding protein
MKILIDTNVVLDVALGRTPFMANSIQVLEWAEMNPRQAAIAWHSVSNIAYILKENPREFLSGLLAFVEVAAGNTATVRQALAMPTRDFEDALQAGAAIDFGAEIIVTRNLADYKRLPLNAMTPTEFVTAFMSDDIDDTH